MPLVGIVCDDGTGNNDPWDARYGSKLLVNISHSLISNKWTELKGQLLKILI